MTPTVLRPRLQRLVERINASILPVVLVPQRRRQASLVRWELRVLTPAKPWGHRIPLSLWRHDPIRWEPRPGHRALPFQHEFQVDPRDWPALRRRMAEEEIRLANMSQEERDAS